MIKVLIIFLFFTLNLSAYSIESMKEMHKKNMKTDVSKFNKLNEIPSSFKMEDFEKLQKVNLIDQLNIVSKEYKGSDFITKNEMNEITSTINKASLLANTPQDFVFYLTSESVPNTTLLNNMLSIGILQSNGINIQSKVYLYGMPEDMQTYMFSIEKDIKKRNLEERDLISRNVNIKIDPRFFDIFELKKAPAIVFATCPNKTPVVDKCEYKYLMRGDTGLVNFFDTISNKDKKFEKYYRILISNKIEEKHDEVKK